MNLKAPWSRVALAVLIGAAIAAALSILQHQFKAGSIPDSACELLLLPGNVIASFFQDRGTASSEFLWRSRIATAVLLSGIAWCCLALRLRRRESRTAPHQ
jgi:hypothetical protein